jgi:hypothetical protein
MVERPTANRAASSFSGGMQSPGFQTRFMMSSAIAETIS